MKKELKTITCEIKNLNDEDRSFDAVASTEDIDRDGDRILAAGWDVANFLKNPVIPWSHNYSEPPVARATEIGVRDGKLMFKPKFPTADEYPFADTIWKLYKGGYLKAFSVGFMPKRWEYVERGAGKRGRDYHEQELWEISACTVPSNPNALVAAKSAGIITEEEEISLTTKTRNDESTKEEDVIPAPPSVIPAQAGIQDKRLDTLEQKLDAVLAALSERQAPVADHQPEPAGENPQRGNPDEKIKPELQKEKHSPITWHDVRKIIRAEIRYALGKVD